MTVLVAFAYLGLAAGVYVTVDPHATGTPPWPAAGLAVAALLLSAPRQWPALLAGLLVADVAAGLVQGASIGVGVGWAIAHLATPLLVVLALRRISDREVVRLDSVRRVLVFGVVVVVSGPPIGALLGALTGVFGLDAPLWPTWPRWLIGHALGILLVAPVLLYARRVWAFGRRPQGAALLAGAAVIPVLVLLPTGNVVHNMPYLVTPVLLAAGLTGGVAGAVAASLVMAVTLNLLGAGGYWGSFAVASKHADSVLLMQLFIAVQSMTTMVVAAQAAALRHADRHMARQEDDLHRDVLTGVGNRLALDRALAAARDERRAVAGAAVLFLDLDDFKQVNDRLGHEAGDALLRDIAGRCVQLVRADDTVARTGGDEFAVVCPDIAHDAAAELRDRLQTELGTVSVGMAWAPSAAGNLAALVSRADADMYAVKATRRAGRTRGDEDVVAPPTA